MMKTNDSENLAAASRHVRQHQLFYPDERVVVFLARNYPNKDHNARRRALDVGCGSGRHLRLLIDYGLQCYGIDYSGDAIEVARRCLSNHPSLKELKVEDIARTQYDAGFFDVVISWGQIYLRPLNGMMSDLQTIHRLLRPGGRLLLNFRSKDNWFYGKGTKVNDQETYILDQSAGSYSSMSYTFVDFAQAEDLLRQTNFEVENSERLDLWEQNCTKQHSWWIFSVRKSGS